MINHPILDGIKQPSDVRRMNKSELNELCSEIRSVMIDTVSKNGGHLASNLGTVELTVAIHRCFDSPKDKIVFDVGHQCYAHKLLTGRLDRFDTLRQKDGVSGFPRPDESEHDSFLAGHSSTSISAAFGMAEAKSIKNSNDYVVAVIGDGSLSGGLAYEALNNAGRTHDNLIVILNDNKMSISKNVGAMSRYLALIRSRPRYYQFKDRTYKILSHIPLIGKPLVHFIMKIKQVIKGLFYNSTIFEDMGFFYLGPVDGHNIEKMCNLFNAAKSMRRPVVIHVNTIKGKGYSFAEQVPTQYHGVSKFDIETGEQTSSGTNFSSEFGKSLLSFADNDKRICAISAAMTESTGLAEFRRKYKQRFYDVGIAEQHAVTFAAGLSISGLIPVFAVYSTFLQRAYDQILHDAAMQHLKMIIAIDRAGVVGEDGETHQGVFDVSFLSAIPDITIYSPATYEELRYDMKTAIYNDKGVVAIRYPRGKAADLEENYRPTNANYDIFGEGKIAVVTYGREYNQVLNAVKRLKNDGIDIKIIKLNRIKPIDGGAVESAFDCDKIYFYEEGMKCGGIGEQFAIKMIEKGFKGEMKICAIDEKFVQHASVAQQLSELHLDENAIYDSIKSDVSGVKNEQEA